VLHWVYFMMMKTVMRGSQLAI